MKTPGQLKYEEWYATAGGPEANLLWFADLEHEAQQWWESIANASCASVAPIERPTLMKIMLDVLNLNPDTNAAHAIAAVVIERIAEKFAEHDAPYGQSSLSDQIRNIKPEELD